MNRSFPGSALTALAFVALLWLLTLLGQALDLPLYRLGVYPQTLAGLPGIVFAPLIHGSWGHLLSNSFALLVLLTALLYGYPRSARPALLLIWLGSGLGVWLFARASWHLGASGLTHGIMFYIFTCGILRRDRPSIALALTVFLLYGGMIWTIFPQQPDISYESHFFGAACGVLAAVLFSRLDPKPPQKHYDWEDEDTDGDGDAENPDVPGNSLRQAASPAGRHRNIFTRSVSFRVLPWTLFRINKIATEAHGKTRNKPLREFSG